MSRSVTDSRRSIRTMTSDLPAMPAGNTENTRLFFGETVARPSSIDSKLQRSGMISQGHPTSGKSRKMVKSDEKNVKKCDWELVLKKANKQSIVFTVHLICSSWHYGRIWQIY